jgi:hypothetical protein
VTGLKAPFDIAVDGLNAYWTDPTAGTVSSIPVDGGTVTTLAQGQQKPWRLAIDSSFAYWTNNLGGAVMRAPKDGSAAPTVVSTAVSPTEIAVVPGGPAGCAGSPFSCAPGSGGSLVIWAGQSIVYDGFTVITPAGPGTVSSVDPRTWQSTLISWWNVNPLEVSWWGPSGSMFDSKYFYVGGGTARTQAVAGFDKATNTAANEGFEKPYGAQGGLLDYDGVGAGCVSFFSDEIGIGPTGQTRTLKMHLSVGNQLVDFHLTSVVNRVAIDSTHVYWADGSGAIGKLPIP